MKRKKPYRLTLNETTLHKTVIRLLDSVSPSETAWLEYVFYAHCCFSPELREQARAVGLARYGRIHARWHRPEETDEEVLDRAWDWSEEVRWISACARNGSMVGVRPRKLNREQE